MENTLIVCGGTGAHTAVAFLRLHTLGHALGFFGRGSKPLDFPALFLVDQDAGDGAEREPTAWQLARSLVAQHPARRDWSRAIGRPEAPKLVSVTPLPVGPNLAWFQRPNNTLEARFESSPFPPLLTSEFQREIDFSKGMMGSPALGSLLFRLKEYDERSPELNHDEIYGEVLESEGRIVVAGSGVGGTGASVGPTLAQQLAERDRGPVMAVMVLEWFEFDQQGDEEIRVRAQRRNRLMRENAHSALEFYGRDLAGQVATVPVGMPDRALVRRTFTGDLGQPIHESFIHVVAALCGYRHFLADAAYRPGLYLMGAVERGRLDGATAIPGGTLQGLANQAATLAHLLETWSQVLARVHDGRVRPAIYDAVTGATSAPEQVADHLRKELDHYREQLRWLDDVVGVPGTVNRDFTREAESRRRLLHDRKPLSAGSASAPEDVASALFHWTAEWVREAASTQNGLEVQPGPVTGGHWPDLRNVQGLGVRAETNGGLDRIDDANHDAVIQAFVHSEYVSANGWPHPLAAADFFHHALRRRETQAVRQLELLLVGLVSGRLELKRVDELPPGKGPSLEALVADARRAGWPGLARVAVVDPRSGGRPLGFNSPHTLFAPVPFMNDEADNRRWDELWRNLTGASDGALWSEAPEPATWGEENDLAIRQVLSWIDQQKRVRGGSAPPWTRVFERFRGTEAGTPYGAGAQVEVYWGASGDAERPLVEVNLPTSEPGVWVPPPGTPTLSEEELAARAPHLGEVGDEAGRVAYSMVELEVPGLDHPVRGWWDEHLNRLRDLGEIHLWSRDEQGAVVLGTIDGGVLKATRLADSRLLDYSTVTIKTCTPLDQDPVPGSSRVSGQVLYPDLPLKAEYLDLMALPGGGRLLDALKAGDEVDLSQWQPTERKESDGRRVVKWVLPLRGRPRPMPVELRLEPLEDLHRAHWMVWPRFRSRRGDGWRTYYVYENSTHPHHRLETLWLEGGSQPRVRRRPIQSQGATYPVAYLTEGETPCHQGGPPLAFCLRNAQLGVEEGLYLIALKVLGTTPVEVELAVDFGTSHSVCAARIGSGEVESVAFAAELDRARDGRGLSLHVSENWRHVEASQEDLGLLAAGAWLPTYTLQSKGMLPSDLILLQRLDAVQADRIPRWAPGADYMIPPLGLARSDLSSYMLTDFKWDVGNSYFHGRESQLQEYYLSMFLELVLAEVIVERCRDLPSGAVHLMFTYPLRMDEKQRERFQQSLGRTLSRCAAGTGLQLALKKGLGIYDESRAARLTSDVFGEVCMVGDLGGGTLDLFISAAPRDAGDPLPEVADSARLGGNLLLRQISRSPNGFLPSEGRWGAGANASRDAETKLRAWMRSLGAHRLFGIEAGERPQFEGLGVEGFAKAGDADSARLLLDSYFRLVIEYMARNLTAYLVRHWFPNVAEEDHDRLDISVQLRGNGWRLRYQKESYTQTTAAVQAMVRSRVLALWDEIEDNPYPAPAAPERWADVLKYAVTDPKTAPIRQVVGLDPMSAQDVQERWHSHTLVDLEVVRAKGERHQVHWWEKVPFKTWGSNNVTLRALSPPLPLSSPEDDREVVLSNLSADSQGSVNRALKAGGGRDPGEGKFHAPVAPLVWETVFESREFWPRQGAKR